MKNQFIDYRGPGKLKEVESILGSFLTKVSPEAGQTSFLITIQEEELSSDLFSVLLLIFAGQDHGQLLANVNGVISPPNLLTPMIPPAPQHSIPHITAFREYRPFPPGSLPNRLKIRGGLKAFHVQSPERCLHNYYSSCYSANT